jgi:hypothetical protein
MKVIVAGSRDLEVSADFVVTLLLDHFKCNPTELVAGGCPTGPDEVAKYIATGAGRLAPYREFPADWETHGKAAGPIRNRQMAEYADALLLIWDGHSRGSKNMRQEMNALGKPIFECILRTIV